jgi:hypothetical protein
MKAILVATAALNDIGTRPVGASRIEYSEAVALSVVAFDLAPNLSGWKIH